MLHVKLQQRPALLAYRSARPVVVRNSLPTFRPSLDPLKNRPQGEYKSGDVYAVHSPAELDKVLKTTAGGKLVVLMCKSSHCKPCKKFGRTYTAIAEHLKDTVFLEITGDETIETRKLMMEMQVKSTPTFRLYRSGEYLGFTTGTKPEKLLSLVSEKLQPGETTPDGLKLPEDDE